MSRTRLAATVVGAVATLTIAAAASAYDVPESLNAVALEYTLGAGEVRCASADVWQADFASAIAYAYTHMTEGYAVPAPKLVLTV